jgi:hypothetical protein
MALLLTVRVLTDPLLPTTIGAVLVIAMAVPAPVINTVLLLAVPAEPTINWPAFVTTAPLLMDIELKLLFVPTMMPPVPTLKRPPVWE